jgi:PAS domain S-box-containing protein
MHTILLPILLSIIVVQLGYLLFQRRAQALLRAERDTLRMERDSFQTILDSLPVLVSHISADERVLFGNAAFQKEHGVRPEMFGRIQLRDALGESVYSSCRQEVQTALRGQPIFFCNIPFVNGYERWAQLCFIPNSIHEILEKGEKRQGFVSMVREVTQEKATEQDLVRHHEQLEQLVQARTAELETTNEQLRQALAERQEIEVALRESEEHFRLLAETVQDAIFRFDMLPEPRLRYISPVVTRLTGYTPEEHYANPNLWRELIHEEDRDHYIAAMRNSIKTSEPVEVRWRCKNGDMIWFEMRYVPVFDEQGNCVTLVGISRDITERHHADEQLRILSRAVEQSRVSISIINAEGLVEYVNPHFTRVTGFTIEDVRGQRPRVLDGHTEFPSEAEGLIKAFEQGLEWRGERRNRTKDGTLYWEAGVVSPIHDNQGRLTHFVVVLENITERKQQEREREAILAVSMALRAASSSDEMLEVVLREIATTFQAEKVFFITPNERGGMAIQCIFEQGALNRDLNISFGAYQGASAYAYTTGQPYVTDSAKDDPGFTATELLGDAQAVACVPLSTLEERIGVFAIARQTPFSSGDVQLLAALADMAATGLARAAYHDQILRYTADLEVAVAEQTRELREAYEQLQELDKLKSKFVSDVSHELRTPVTNMGLYLGLIQRKPEKQEHYLAVLREETARLETLVQDVLNLVRLDNAPTLNLGPINLNELLQGVVDTYQPKAESQYLELDLQAEATLPLLMGDTNKLIQIATNLIANAINYTRSGYVRVHTGQADAEHVCFAVEDSGTGIYPEDLPHIFDRFYRGRRDQITDVPGTGLGLSIVKELVELHNGSIRVESEVGRGTTFIVTLPVLPPSEREAA